MSKIDNVKIKKISLDEIAKCEDCQRVAQEDDGSVSIYGINKSILAWLRAGLDVENADDYIRTLGEDEKAELVAKIKKAQHLGEGKPSH